MYNRPAETRNTLSTAARRPARASPARSPDRSASRFATVRVACRDTLRQAQAPTADARKTSGPGAHDRTRAIDRSKAALSRCLHGKIFHGPLDRLAPRAHDRPRAALDAVARRDHLGGDGLRMQLAAFVQFVQRDDLAFHVAVAV